MTESSDAPQSDEQRQLTKQVGLALLKLVGEDWKEIRAEYRSAGKHIEVDVVRTGADGSEEFVQPSMDVVELLGRLRLAMYQEGRGTWLSGVYRLAHPGKFSAAFEPDAEPQWRRTPPPIGFVDELKFFPRDDEHIPDWWRQRVGIEPPKPAEQPAPQQQTGAAAQQQSPPSPPQGTPAAQPVSPPQGFPRAEPVAPQGFPPQPRPASAPTPAHGFPQQPAQQPAWPQAPGPGGQPAQPGRHSADTPASGFPSQPQWPGQHQ